jgi:murein L,D-transpeptidase YcbB/YkuD
MKRPAIATFCLAALAFFFTSGVVADEIQEIIRSRIDTLHETGGLTVGQETIAAVRLIPKLYQDRDFRLIWTRPAMVETLLTAIEEAPDQGLDPNDYHFEAIRSRLDIAAQGLEGTTSLVDLDLLLTDAFARYAFTLHFGKLNPEDIDPVWNLSREFTEGGDGVELFSMALDTGSIREFLIAVAPDLTEYRRFVAALKEYRELAEAGGWPTVSEGPVLEPGDRSPRVTELRARLAVTDGLETTAGDPELFDEEVEEAVKRFQDRHHLDTDGKIGPKTDEALNISIEARIDQIRASLERMRWVFRDVPDDFIVADIAGFQLILFRDRQRVWTTRIQVGKPYHATPVFKEVMTYLVINPTWTIPPGILRKETLPAIRRDPDYLKKKNMSVIRSDGSVVDPSTVDFNGKFPYGVRQEPGPSNALGRVKFIFPNPYFVYFHDTPSKSLFGRSARAFSHGCIRTENPLDLAALLLEDNEGWDRTRIDKVVDSAKMTTVTLAEPMTVFLLYWTAEVRADGTIGFREDIYHRDPKIIDGLDRPFRFEAPSKLPASLR